MNQIIKIKSGITIIDLQKEVNDASITVICYEPVVLNDLKGSGVEFDLENFTCDSEYPFNMPGFVVGYKELPNGSPVLWCAAGGDWERPIAFIVYLGEDSRLHAYIPTDGNCFNKETKAAFGNDISMSADEEIEEKGIVYTFDMAKMEEEIVNILT